MAQLIKLKRTAVEGKVPSTSNLQLGELAINTYDGRIFFERNDGSETIQQIVTSNSTTTGSLNIIGAVTASYFSGDGSALTNINSTPPAGTVSGSSQISHDSTTGFVANEHIDHSSVSITAGEHFLQSAITTVGTVTTGNVQAILPSGTISGSSQVSLETLTGGSGIQSGSITNADLAGSIANSKLSNSAITISGTSVSLGGSITDETLFGGVGVVTGSAQISHDSTTGFVANEHIDHSSVSITAGTGLNGGGTIASTRTLNVDSDYKNDSLNAFTASNANTSLNAATSSYLTSVDISSDTNLAVSDTTNVDMILSGDTLSANLKGGVVSGSGQITHDSTTGFVANEHIDHSSVSITAGTGLNGGGNITTTRTLNVDSDYKNDSLNAFTASNANTSLNAATSSYLTTVDISSDTNLSVSDTTNVDMILSGDTLSANLKGGVISGSSQVSHDSTTGFVANEHINHGSVSIIAGTGLNGGGTIASSRTLNVDSDYKNDSLNSFTSSLSSADISDVDAFSQSGTYSGLRAQSTTAGDVGLGNVTNESKSTMFTSPTFTGTPLSTTPSANDNSTKIATTAYVQTELTDLVGNAPAAFDTLGEISASLAADSGALDSLTTVVSGKLQKDQNLSDLTNVSTARSNLGLGSVATLSSIDISSNTNLAVSDTSEVNMILSGDTLSAELIGGVVSGSSQVSHDSTSGFVANEHINHGSVSITAGTGLNGGGTIAATRTLNVDSDYKNDSLNTFTSSFSSFGLSLIDDANASTARSTLGVDAAGTDNSTDVSLGGSYDYITISGQTITRNQIDLTTDVTGVLPSANLDSDTAHLSGTQTFTGAKTFSDVVTIQDSLTASNPLLKLYNDTNGGGATIEFSDQATTQAQKGKFTFYHSDGSSQGGNAMMQAHSTEADFVFLVGDSTNKGRYLSKSGGDTSEVDYGFFDDVNTGMYRPGTDQVGLVAGGSRKLLINSSGVSVQNGDLSVAQDVTLTDGSLTITQSSGTETFKVTTAYDRVGKLESTDAGAFLAIQDNTSTDNGVGINVTGDVLKLLTANTAGITLDASQNTTFAGDLTVAGNSLIGNSLTDSHIFSGSVTIEASGSTVFDIQGSSGQLFSITDSLSGDIFSVGDISGAPIFNVNSSGTVTIEDQLDVSGSIYATGDVVAYASSDERFKDNIISIGNPNEKIKQIGGYEFDWNENQNTYKGHDVGVIAQEIEKVLPEVVTTRDNGYKAVKYEKLVALLIESNKELINRVEELEKKLEDNGNI